MRRVTITYREVRDWPGRPTSWRKDPPFKGSPKMWNALEREISMLGVYACEIFGYFRARDFRRDGGLYADARPTEPGVVLEFKRNDQRYRFACDKFKFWQDNLDAIVRSLEGLRIAERYGVFSGQQYEGFKALPETSSARATDNVRAAAELIVRLTGNGTTPAAVLKDAMSARDAFRRARVKAHPDSGGNHADFVALNQAAAALTGYFGQKIDG